MYMSRGSLRTPSNGSWNSFILRAVMRETIGERHASACRYNNEVPEGLRRSARRNHLWPRPTVPSDQTSLLLSDAPQMLMRAQKQLAIAGSDRGIGCFAK